MIVIEAVDTGCWNAIAGAQEIVTVEECAEELRRGDSSMSGYVRCAMRISREPPCGRCPPRPTPPFVCSTPMPIVSIEALAANVGVRPRRPFRRQYTVKQLDIWRTSLILETGT